LKIPVEKFDDIYNNIKNIDGEITYASYYTDDITQEYTDLESRLRNLQETEEQLVEILETAETVEDTLAVYEQLTSIRSQIEVLEGQIKYLDNQVDYSYITVTLTLSDVGKEITDEQWNPLGVLKMAFGSLVNFGKFLVNVLIWLIVFSPAIAIAVVIVVLIKKNVKKKK
jgi:DNA repair ATPase RecN